MMPWHIMKNILDQIFHFQTWKEVQIKLLNQCTKLVSIIYEFHFRWSNVYQYPERDESSNSYLESVGFNHLK